MKKLLVIGAIVVLAAGFFIWNYFDNQGGDDLGLFKGIPSAKIPSSCLSAGSNVCELFDCMVELCWCADGPEAILYEKDEVIDNEDDAKSIAGEYINFNGLNYKVNGVVKLNNIFYNVFAQDAEGNEEVFTVAVDGTIIKTICGV